MADVFIAVTRPEILPEEWPPRGSVPASNEPASYFRPTGEPIQRDQAPIIAATVPEQEEAPRPAATTPISNAVDRSMVPSFEPISNDGKPAIYARAEASKDAPVDAAPIGMVSNADVKIIGGGATISNEQGAAVIHHLNTSQAPEAAAIAAPVVVPAPPAGAPVSNESSVSFSRASFVPPQYFADQSIPTNPFLTQRGDTFVAPSAGHMPAAGDTTISQKGNGVINVDTDRSIGGGGDPTKMAGSDSVIFGGTGQTVDVGSLDVKQALTGDGSKAPNADNFVLAPSADSIGSQEVQKGAEGAPVANKDYNELAIGAFGKPKRVTVT